MNNVNISGMNAMGGPVGGNVPMMNNGAPGGRQQMAPTDQKTNLNTYIYEYFIRNGMWDCARSLVEGGFPLNVTSKDSPSRRRDDNTDDGGEDSKDDTKQPLDLPHPNLPSEAGDNSCFLFEWWCLFWDMFKAQRGSVDGRNISQYVTHTQTVSRARQEQQQAMLRGIRNGGNNDMGQYQQMMMRNQANGMNLNQNSNLNPTEQLRQKAIANQQNQQRAGGPQMQMLAQQKQQQMQRAPSDGSNQRPQSPGSAENAPSPSKRPRLDGAPFNQGQMPNGRGQGGGMPQQVGDTGPSNALQVAHMQLTNGIESNNLTAQQFPNVPGGQNNGNAQARVTGLAGYQATLAQQQSGQMATVKAMPNQGGPANAGSPMMTQPDNGAIANYYNPVDLGANAMRNNPGGVAGAGGGNHALQDYQMQLMLLEQQNKKRLMMARQEQENIAPRPDQGNPGVVGPNGQPFQGTSPQGGRSVNSPNPGDQIKRGTPHMNNAGMPSPLPEGQSRGSPGGGMNFNMPGQIDQGMNQQYFKMGGNGMDPSLGGGMQNGMRPPNPHPGNFPNGMTQQQMAMARQQQMQQQGGGVQNWPNGPNGQMMPQGAQGIPQQNMGTPQPRSMPPPSAPAVGPVPNGRTQPPSPQQNPAPPTPSQAKKANPKKAESKDNKAKRATKKGSTANLNAGATPSADTETAATPTPATPITPVHPKSFNGQNGVVQPNANGQAAASNAGVVPQQPDPLQAGGFNMNDTNYDFNPGMDFANPGGGMDVLQDFDFDSFLHNDEQGNDLNFDSTFVFDNDGIGAD